jgi:hypothetical protein
VLCGCVSSRRWHRRRLRAIIAAGVALAACSVAPQAAPPAPAAPPARRDGALHVILTWAAPVDLDLYLTDPAGETLYFANNPTRAGARLEQDARCGATPPGSLVEAVRMDAPVAGRYRVGVDFIDRCGSRLAAVPFRVAVDHGPMRREVDGTAAPNQFQVIVLEFDVEDDGNHR